MRHFLFFISILIFVSKASAVTLESQTQAGGFTQSEGLQLSGNFVDDKDLDALLRYWNLVGGIQKMKDPTTDLWTSGNFFSGGLGWDHHKKETFNLDADYSKIPDEGLTTLAFTGEFGIKKYLAKPAKSPTDNDDDDSSWFQPYVKPALRVAVANYTQTADYVAKKSAVKQEKKLGQSMLGFAFAYSPVSLLSAKIGYDVYGYGKNVNDFLSTLNKNTISSTRWSGLANSLYDLNLWDSDFTLGLYLFDNVDFRFYYKYGIAATDHTVNWTGKFLTTFYVTDNFTVEPGYEHFYSSTLTDNLALLNISYNFQ